MQALASIPAPPQALGYAPMDDIHAEFHVLVQALADAPDAQLVPALDAVARHCQSHFEQEEAWMTSADFPARQCHADEHAAVLASLGGVQRRLQAGETAPVRTLAQALADWFPAHADRMDAALAHWMCKRRFGGKPVVLHRRRSHETLVDAT